MAKPCEFRWAAYAKLYVRAAMALCLVVPVIQARAAAIAMPEMRAVAAPDTAPAWMPVPAAADCTPCAACYVAPAPAPQGFNGDDLPAAPNQWFALPPLVSNATVTDTSRWSAALPARITFCRWLN